MTDEAMTWDSPDDRIGVERDDEDEDWPLSITFDDWIAHEHEDLVAEFVTAAAARPGVIRVVHEDREVVLLQAGPEVSVEDLGAWSHDWFAERLPDAADGD